MSVTIIHSPTLSEAQKTYIAGIFGGYPIAYDNHFRVDSDIKLTHQGLDDVRHQLAMDVNTLPEEFASQDVRLLIMDMDSTLINIECVDEIADFIGVKPQVAAITEAAMRGELDFAASLTRRVALLEGLDDSALRHVYEERLQLNPGGEILLKGLQKHNIKTALVSGGFTFFTERLKQKLGLDYTLANVLDIKDHRMTGKVQGEIVGAEAKAAYLLALCRELNIEPTQAIAMGDGANDLLMLDKAGLGIAYHAKPAVRAQADVSIQYGGLDSVLDFIA